VFAGADVLASSCDESTLALLNNPSLNGRHMLTQDENGELCLVLSNSFDDGTPPPQTVELDGPAGASDSNNGSELGLKGGAFGSFLYSPYSKFRWQSWLKLKGGNDPPQHPPTTTTPPDHERMTLTPGAGMSFIFPYIVFVSSAYVGSPS